MADQPRKLQSLVRSLNLIPYLRNHPGLTPMEAAEDLGMTPVELKDAIDRLFCSGVGRNTEDLIDLSFSYRDGIEIYNDQGLTQALRLTPTEAGALLLTLESLEAMPGLVDAGRRREDNLVELTAVRRDWLVRTAAGYAPDVVVIEPPEVRADIIALLNVGGNDTATTATTVKTTEFREEARHG